MMRYFSNVWWPGLLSLSFVAGCEISEAPSEGSDSAGAGGDAGGSGPAAGGSGPHAGGAGADTGSSEDSGTSQSTNTEGGEATTSFGGAGGEAGVAQGTIRGRVTDTTGRELGGVAVRVGDERVKTDTRGLFEVTSLASGRYQVAVVDSNYSASQTSVTVDGAGVAQVALAALPMQVVEVVLDAEAGNTVTLGGATLELPLNGVVDADGEPVTGALEVRYAEITDPQALLAAPGGMLATDDDELLELESFGMIDIEIYQDGELLELSEPAQLTLPVTGLATGETVPIWSFDVKGGTWMNEGEVEVNTSGQVMVSIPTLSWWNCDRPLAEKSCITGRLVGDNGEGVAGVHINVTGVDYLTNLSATSDADGTFCATVKRASTNRLAAFGAGRDNYFTFTSGDVVAADAPASCDLGSCTSLGDLTGEPLFGACDGNVTDDDNHVLVLSSGSTSLDDTVQATLERFGNEVTIGPEYTAFDDTVSLADYDVVYLQANSNWSAGDMPIEGQRQLINWVNCGGGLITVEWTVWKIGTGQFALLDSVYPTVPTTTYGSSATAGYVRVTPDSTMNHGLPEAFTFAADDFAGTEIDLTPRPGSTEFYRSETRIAGVVGWDFNLGRVLSFSTVGGAQELADTNYAQLIGNAVNWLQRDPPSDPED